MAHHTHQCHSPAVYAATPDAVARESNRPVIDLNRPPPEDLMDDRDLNSTIFDCKSVASSDQSGAPPLPVIGSGLMELNEEDYVHHLIKEHLVSRLAMVGVQVTSVAIHGNYSSDVSAKARAEAFQVCSQEVQQKGRDNTANVEFAWYAASKQEVSNILSFGFGCDGKPENNGLNGHGVYFAPYGYPLESVISAPFDEDGLRHLLLCRVILGKSELVSLGSGQSHLSSEEYDSGVDNLSFPRRYIIRSTHMNTRVLPVYIVSFRVSCGLRDKYEIGFLTTPEKPGKSTTPWTPFSSSVWELLKILPPSHVSMISKYHKDQKERKITRHELIQKLRQIEGDTLLNLFMENLRIKVKKIPKHELRQILRQITGDRLLIEIIKHFIHKESNIPRHELMQNFMQIAGDRLLIEIIEILETKQFEA